LTVGKPATRANISRARARRASRTARAAEKRRRQNLAATRLMVFAHTNRFRPEDPQYYAVQPVTLPLEIMEQEPDCWYHYQFYYYGTSVADPDKELITTIGVKSIITQPNDDTETMSPGVHMIRGYAWSGAGAIDHVDVSVDGGETWHSAHIEQPRDRFMWVRWSYRWDVRRRGTYRLMSRATDEVGRVQSREPRYNNMRKNFSAIVGVTVA
jgi:hypothetical protein